MQHPILRHLIAINADKEGRAPDNQWRVLVFKSHGLPVDHLGSRAPM